MNMLKGRLLLEREARAPNLSSWLLLYIPMFFRSKDQ
ncbi:hypothetical protein PRUPE_3G101200 [Prunus persica]|uniref:Uncharacterized protein n=1 Tax=Prunus persica TaxID=3760 RepID=A0A251Q1A9_PRUPE|nr:hypothetical protein PRUPE_3G101200 [Prunus persica]